MMDYKAIWDELTEDERVELDFAATVYGCFVANPKSEAAAGLVRRGLTDKRGYILSAGYSVYNAGNPPADADTATLRDQLAAAKAERDAYRAALMDVLKFADVSTAERTNLRDLSKFIEVTAGLRLADFRTATTGRLGDDDLANALYHAAAALAGEATGSDKEDSQG